MPLQGAQELIERLTAVGTSGQGLALAWAEDAAERMRAAIQVRTGATRGSIRAVATPTGGRVMGSFVAPILDKGAKAHDEKPRRARDLRWGSQPMFAKRVHNPGFSGRHFRAKAAVAALEDKLTPELIMARWTLRAK